MTEYILTKEMLDKVRNTEGFPIAKDEDIIALSDPPYYMACPNPFIGDFLKEHCKLYDEKTNDYHREPFAFDVSAGKNFFSVTSNIQNNFKIYPYKES